MLNFGGVETHAHTYTHIEIITHKLNQLRWPVTKYLSENIKFSRIITKQRQQPNANMHEIRSTCNSMWKMQSAEGIPKRESTFILCQRPMPKQISTQHVADTFSHDLPFCANSRCEWELVETYQRSCLHSDCMIVCVFDTIYQMFRFDSKAITHLFLYRWKSFFYFYHQAIHIDVVLLLSSRFVYLHLSCAYAATVSIIILFWLKLS